MAGVQHNARQLAAMLGRLLPAMRDELEPEVALQGQLVGRTMRSKAPAFQSLLLNSIQVEDAGLLTVKVSPGVRYAAARETGTRPGRGLPRFEDPAANDIVRWLQTKAFAGTKTPKRNSMKAVQRNLELRDRYQGLAWHVRHRGTKASPFVKPTADEMAVPVASALAEAVRRAMSAVVGAA